MVNREKYTKITILKDLEDRFERKIDKAKDLYKYYKIGEEQDPEELSYLSLQMRALCSGYCSMEDFITKTLIRGEKESCTKPEPEQRYFWEDHLRYRKCILERAFNSETNKCKELYEWMYSPDPHNM